MKFRTLLSMLGKLLLAAIGYEVGVVLGGMLVTVLGLPAPNTPPGSDMTLVARYMFFTTPLYALALAILATRLKGGFIARWLSLAFLMWVAYTVNTQLEAAIVSSYATGRAFAVVSGAVSALVVGAAVAWLFPPDPKGGDALASIRAFFARRSAASWAWRLVVAAVVFMPVYFAFGLVVLPFTGAYYQEQMFGLAMPTAAQLFPTLFARSVLFLLAVLPIIALWQGSRLSLFWRLGLSLFMLVGFNIMLIATWLPPYVRIPHILEILADESVYAGLLVWLLPKRTSKGPVTARPVTGTAETSAGSAL